MNCICCTPPFNETWYCNVCRVPVRISTHHKTDRHCVGEHYSPWFWSHCKVCVFCSERCRGVARARRATYQRRTDRRRRTEPDIDCVVCHRMFKPKRIDALTCSPACRQKLYRKRNVTDASALQKLEPSFICNAT
jgi:hypothetical protein